MKVNDLILCRSCENSKEKGYSAFHIFGALGVEKLPDKISFCALVSIFGLKDGKSHVDIILQDDEKSIIATAAGDVQYRSNDIIGPKFSGVNLSACFENVLIKRDGVYSINVVVDTETVGEKEFFIYCSNK